MPRTILSTIILAAAGIVAFGVPGCGPDGPLRRGTTLEFQVDIEMALPGLPSDDPLEDIADIIERRVAGLDVATQVTSAAPDRVRVQVPSTDPEDLDAVTAAVTRASRIDIHPSRVVGANDPELVAIEQAWTRYEVALSEGDPSVPRPSVRPVAAPAAPGKLLLESEGAILDARVARLVPVEGFGGWLAIELELLPEFDAALATLVERVPDPEQRTILLDGAAVAGLDANQQRWALTRAFGGVEPEWRPRILLRSFTWLAVPPRLVSTTPWR